MAGTQDGALVQQFYTLVNEILGFPRHLSQHVGGFVIADVPVWTLVPIENAAMAERTIIQWDKEDIEALGLLKVDVLALGMLTAIRKTLALIGGYSAQPLRISDIPADDPATYAMLQQADSVGVFQVESRAQMTMLPRLKPTCFYDLVIQVAIIRPGPIQGDMVHPFLRRRNGEEPVQYASAEIESVLKRTLGVPIFQEQAIKLAMVAAGFSGGEADQLRRAMASWGRNGNLLVFRDKLVNGMLARGYELQFAQRLFEQMKGFGGYGFPESHSASFALLAYVSAWLKCHHPVAFYCGLLNSQPMGFYSPSQLVQDAQRHGITVLPIDVQHSQGEHTLVQQDVRARTPPTTLRLGLRLVKGLSAAAAQRIVLARAQKKFVSLFDLRQRAQLARDDIEALAAADALHTLAGHRHQAHWRSQSLPPSRPLLHEVDVHAVAADDAGSHAAEIELAAPSAVQTVLADYASTGLTLNTHPMALLRTRAPFDRCKTHAQLADIGHGRFVRIAGIVTCRQRPGTASGVLFLTLEDETGNSNIVIWKDVQQRFRRALLGARILLVKGVVERKQSVIHVIAGELHDCTAAFAQLQTMSRDFH